MKSLAPHEAQTVKALIKTLRHLIAARRRAAEASAPSRVLCQIDELIEIVMTALRQRLAPLIGDVVPPFVMADVGAMIAELERLATPAPPAPPA